MADKTTSSRNAATQHRVKSSQTETAADRGPLLSTAVRPITQEEYAKKLENFKRRSNSSHLFNQQRASSSGILANHWRRSVGGDQSQSATESTRQLRALKKADQKLLTIGKKPPVSCAKSTTSQKSNSATTLTEKKLFNTQQLSASGLRHHQPLTDKTASMTTTTKLEDLQTRKARNIPSKIGKEKAPLKREPSWQDLPSVTPQFKAMASKTVPGSMHKLKQEESEETRVETRIRNSLEGLRTIGSCITPENMINTDEYGFTTPITGGFTYKGRQAQAAKTMTTGWNSTQNLTTVEPSIISTNIQTHVSSLIKADSNHDKSTRLFLFLKKQARKQITNEKDGVSMYESRQDQRKMLQAAMDKSVKVGPVQVPAKLKRAEALEKASLKKPQPKKSIKKIKKFEKVTQESQHNQEEEIKVNSGHQTQKTFAESTAAERQSTQSILQNFKPFNDDSKKDYEKMKEDAPFNFQQAIFNLLEKSCNLKLVAKRQELMEEMETEMKIQGFKVKERNPNNLQLTKKLVQNHRTQHSKPRIWSQMRVINKIFERELDLDDIFLDRGESDDEEEGRPTQKGILTRSMQKCDDLVDLCNEVTTENVEVPLVDEMQDSDDELPWKESRRQRALKQVNRCLDRQKNLLIGTGVEMEEPPILDFEPRPFEDDNKPRKQRALAKLIKEKFGTDGMNKVEIKTSEALFAEVVAQVKLWSGKHADLITALNSKQKSFRIENQRLVQKKAHMVRDKLAKELMQLTTKLERTQQELEEKTRLLDQSIKAQQVMDKNITKAYELFHASGTKMREQEIELKRLRSCLIKWMPNFQQYGFQKAFDEGIRFITEDQVLKEGEEESFWEKQEINKHFDAEAQMWGFTPRTNPDTIFYNNDSLRMKYTKQELWLRSDIVRLTKIFNVATPEKVELENIKKSYNMMQWKNNQMDDMISNQQKELRVRWKQVEQLKTLEVNLLREQSRLLAENTHMKGQLDVGKTDKGVQVEIISLKMATKLSKADKKILAQYRMEQKALKKKNSTAQLRKSATVEETPLLDTLPTFDNKLRMDALQDILKNADAKTPQQRQAQAIQQAGSALGRMHEIDFKNLVFTMDKRAVKKRVARKKLTLQVELEPKFTQLGQFYSQLVLKYPFENKSAWQTLVDVLEDNSNDMMQGLHDIYSLGEEDWRFLLVQYVSGIFFNKTDDLKQVNSCIVDRFESAPANLVSILLINAKIDTDTIFGQQIDPNWMVDIDIALQSIAKGLRHMLKNQRIFLELVFPQVIVHTYMLLLREIETIEAIYFESATLERMIYSLEVSKQSEAAVQQVNLFNKIVNAINKVGLSELEPDVSQDTDEVSLEAFMTFVSEKLEVEIPSEFADPEAFGKFVQHRILNFKSHSVNNEQTLEEVDKEIDEEEKPQTTLTKTDLARLEHINIINKVPLRKALLAAVQAAYSLIRIRQSYFEPIFNRYADRLTVGSLNLEGTFYQSLLFVAKSNISNVFLDNLSQNTATLHINERARLLINNLKKMPKLKQISLAKFTNICLELDLLEYVPATLKRLGKGSMLKLPNALFRCSESIQEINPAFPKSNQIIHSKAQRHLKNNEIMRLLNQVSKQFFMHKSYCAVLLRSKFFSTVFDITEEDKIASSFNIFLDCELSELNQLITVANMTVNTNKKPPVLKGPQVYVNVNYTGSPPRSSRRRTTIMAVSPIQQRRQSISNAGSPQPRASTILEKGINHARLNQESPPKDSRLGTIKEKPQGQTLKNRRQSQSMHNFEFQSEQSSNLNRLEQQSMTNAPSSPNYYSPSVDEPSQSNFSPQHVGRNPSNLSWKGIQPQAMTASQTQALPKTDSRDQYLESIIESDLVSRSEAVSVTPDLTASQTAAPITIRPSPLAQLSEKSSSESSSSKNDDDQKDREENTNSAEEIGNSSSEKILNVKITPISKSIEEVKEAPIEETPMNTPPTRSQRQSIKLSSGRNSLPEQPSAIELNKSQEEKEERKIIEFINQDDGDARVQSAKKSNLSRQARDEMETVRDMIMKSMTHRNSEIRAVEKIQKGNLSMRQEVASASLVGTNHPQSSSEYSSTPFQHISYPKIEVLQHSPGGQKYNLMNERGEYYRKSSAQQSRRQESAGRGRPPPYYSNNVEKSIQQHKQRIARGQAQNAVFRSFTNNNDQRLETNQSSNINCDLQHIDDFLLDAAGDPTPKQRKSSARQDSSRLLKPGGVQGRHSIQGDIRSKTMKAEQFGVLHGPARGTDLLGKGLATITRVMMPDGSEEPAAESSRSRSQQRQRMNKFESSHKPQEQMHLTMLPKSRERTLSSRQSPNQQRRDSKLLSKGAETKIKLLQSYKKSKLGDATAAQDIQQDRLILVTENQPKQSSSKSPKNHCKN